MFYGLTRARVAAISFAIVASFGMAQFEMEMVVRENPVAGKSVVARIPMVESLRNGGTVGAHAYDSVLLVFRCNNDGLAIFLEAKRFETFSGYPPTIVYRFSNGQPSTTHRWSAAALGAVLPGSHHSAFYANAKTADSVAILWRDGTRDFTFIYGFEEFQRRAVPELDACLR